MYVLSIRMAYISILTLTIFTTAAPPAAAKDLKGNIVSGASQQCTINHTDGLKEPGTCVDALCVVCKGLTGRCYTKVGSPAVCPTAQNNVLKMQRREPAVQIQKAPRGHKWVAQPNGTLVAVPIGATALIPQGLDGLKCVCRVSGLDKCSHLVEDNGGTAKCFSDSTGGCGSNDNCMFKGAPVPGRQIQLQQSPQIAK